MPRIATKRPLTEEQRELARRNVGLVYRVADKIVKRWSLPFGWDREDVVSACWVGYLIACRQYDPGKGTRLSTFVACCCLRAVWREIRVAMKRVHHQIEGEEAIPAKDYNPNEDREVLDLMVVRGKELLSLNEYKVLRGLLDGMTRRQVATHIGVSLEAVRAAKRRISNKLQKVVTR